MLAISSDASSRPSLSGIELSAESVSWARDSREVLLGVAIASDSGAILGLRRRIHLRDGALPVEASGLHL